MFIAKYKNINNQYKNICLQKCLLYFCYPSVDSLITRYIKILVCIKRLQKCL